MKVLHLTLNDNSGAGKAVLRLNQGLRKLGIESSILVAGRYSGSSSVFEPAGFVYYYKKLQPLLMNTFIKRKLVKDTVFSVNSSPSLILREINRFKPDIINLHWIGWEFLKIEDFKKLKRPLVWTLHDMWPFTGGCHVDGGCGNYTHGCGNCPYLLKPGQSDLSAKVWQRKKNAWQNMDINIIAPGRWMHECASKSPLFKKENIHHVPNSLDTEIFKPMDKLYARKAFNLPEDKKLVLIVVDALPGPEHKGFNHFQEAIRKLAERKGSANIELVICGVDPAGSRPDLGLKAHYTGRLYDNTSIALLYSSADVFVTPSVQDNLPNTIMEALACGTPVAAFKIGGIPDMVDHKKNGYLAPPFDRDELARGIEWILEDSEKARGLSLAARKKAEKEYPLSVQAKRYEEIYRKISG